jgi:hypothetical protein
MLVGPRSSSPEQLDAICAFFLGEPAFKRPVEFPRNE